MGVHILLGMAFAFFSPERMVLYRRCHSILEVEMVVTVHNPAPRVPGIKLFEFEWSEMPRSIQWGVVLTAIVIEVLYGIQTVSITGPFTNRGTGLGWFSSVSATTWNLCPWR